MLMINKKSILILVLLIVIVVWYYVNKLDKDITPSEVPVVEDNTTIQSENVSSLAPESVESENTNSEVFTNQPGAVKSITPSGENKWILSVDLLSRNMNWRPGDDSSGGFFLNLNPKLRNLVVTNKTKVYSCEWNNGNDTSPDNLINTKGYMQNLQEIFNRLKLEDRESEGVNMYLDVEGENIVVIHEQCLP